MKRTDNFGSENYDRTTHRIKHNVSIVLITSETLCGAVLFFFFPNAPALPSIYYSRIRRRYFDRQTVRNNLNTFPIVNNIFVS